MTIETIATQMGIPKEALLTDNELSRYRRSFMLKAFQEGASVEEIADYLQRRPSSVLHVLRMFAHDRDRGDYSRDEKQLAKVLR